MRKTIKDYEKEVEYLKNLHDEKCKQIIGYKNKLSAILGMTTEYATWETIIDRVSNNQSILKYSEGRTNIAFESKLQENSRLWYLMRVVCKDPSIVNPIDIVQGRGDRDPFTPNHLK